MIRVLTMLALVALALVVERPLVRCLWPKLAVYSGAVRAIRQTGNLPVTDPWGTPWARFEPPHLVISAGPNAQAGDEDDVLYDGHEISYEWATWWIAVHFVAYLDRSLVALLLLLLSAQLCLALLRRPACEGAGIETALIVLACCIASGALACACILVPWPFWGWGRLIGGDSWSLLDWLAPSFVQVTSVVAVAMSAVALLFLVVLLLRRAGPSHLSQGQVAGGGSRSGSRGATRGQDLPEVSLAKLVGRMAVVNFQVWCARPWFRN